MLTVHIAAGTYSTAAAIGSPWTAANSPYILDGAVKLDGAAATLTILSGVQVQGPGTLSIDDACPARRNIQLGNEIKRWGNCLSNSG
ncbi:MAG: hypothetical protein ABSH20_31305 [Tepidisphaeraceae bacterium]